MIGYDLIFIFGIRYAIETFILMLPIDQVYSNIINKFRYQSLHSGSGYGRDLSKTKVQSILLENLTWTDKKILQPLFVLFP